MRNLIQGLLLALAPSLSLAQFPPTPSGLITVKSKVDPAVTISYKEVSMSVYPYFRDHQLKSIEGANMQATIRSEDLQRLRPSPCQYSRPGL